MAKFFDRRLLNEAQKYRAGLALTVAVAALGGAATVGQAFVLSQAVADVFLEGRDLAAIWPWLRALIALTVGRAGAAWLAEITAGRVATRVKTALRTRLLDHLLALGPAYAQGERVGELVNTAAEGVEALDAYFSQYLPQVALAALIPALFLAFIFPSDPLTGAVLLLTAPLIPLFMVLIGSLADALTRRQWAALARMSAYFLDLLQGLTTLKLFGRSREQIATIRQITGRHRDATLAVLRVAFLSALVLEMVGTLSTAIVAVEIGLRLLYGKMAFQQAFFVLILAPEFYLPLRLLGTRFHAGIAGVAAAERIFAVLEAEAPADPGRNAPRGGEGCVAPTAASGPLVRLADVRYAYPGRALPALDGVSLEIWPGEKVALIGPTGAGKSTVAALLLGFIAPTAGAVACAAEPPAIAWVPQTPHLFDASVADNIRLGRPDATLAEVECAAAAAYADAFIRDLPQGYATHIGERGSRLSAGQAQRIALARAFLLDAPLVILDEPTAHLDAATEAAVQAASERLLQGRSALIIAHRLNTVRRADRVVVLERGRIVVSGPADVVLAGRRPEDLQIWPTAGPADGATREIQPEPTVGSASAAPLAAHDRSPLRAPAVFRRLLAFLAPSWRWVALSVMLGFLTIASSIGLLAASAWIIAAAALQPSVAVLQVAIVGVRFFGISRGLLRYGERLASHQVAFRVLAEIRVWFYAAIEPLAPAGLAGQHSGDLLSRIVADIAALEHFFIRAIAPPLVALLTAALMAVFLGAYHPALIGPALAGLASVGLAASGLTLALARRPGRRLADQRARLNALLVDGIQGAADLVAFRAASRTATAVRDASAALGRTQIQLAALAGLSSALGILNTWLTMAAVLATAIPLATTGRLSGLDLAVLALATGASFEAATPLPLAAQYLAHSLAAGRRLLALTVAAQPACAGRPGGQDGPIGAGGPPAIRFRSVTLRYAADRPPALERVTFDAPAGSIVAIVGPSGAGKTSLVNALLRFWDYEAGEIYLGEREIRTLAPEAVRAQIGVAAHDPHLFNLTVAENLRLARPSASQAELEAAARAAGVHDFIASLPEEYDTWLGEGGARLSGGERQKLAIARALLKDASVLVLDEPTAHLDADAERQVAEALAHAARGRTALLITHRLPLARIADQIIVLEGGRVVERRLR